MRRRGPSIFRREAIVSILPREQVRFTAYGAVPFPSRLSAASFPASRLGAHAKAQFPSCEAVSSILPREAVSSIPPRQQTWHAGEGAVSFPAVRPDAQARAQYPFPLGCQQYPFSVAAQAHRRGCSILSGRLSAVFSRAGRLGAQTRVPYPSPLSCQQRATRILPIRARARGAPAADRAGRC